MARMSEKVVFAVVFKGHKHHNPRWAAVYDCNSLEEMDDWIRTNIAIIEHVGYTLPGTFKALQELINFKGWMRGVLGLDDPFAPDTEEEIEFYDDICFRMKHLYSEDLKKYK